MKSFLEFLNENQNGPAISILCGMKFTPKTGEDEGFFSEFFGDYDSDKRIEIRYLPVHHLSFEKFNQFWNIQIIFYKAQKTMGIQSLVIKKTKKDLEKFLKEFLLQALEQNIVKMNEFPDKTQAYFHEKRGEFTSKNIGIT